MFGITANKSSGSSSSRNEDIEIDIISTINIPITPVIPVNIENDEHISNAYVEQDIDDELLKFIGEFGPE
ncbi:hypothetical protein MFLAVUS_000340 [Mucor flavus]|uniref:Uncharacterized protein n=1 Tax=Mucor flavus TaxID=439312 RepID=A0ABP9YJF7_9FUNG